LRLREHVRQPLRKYQRAHFQLTVAVAERTGLDLLSKNALGSNPAGRPDAVADALALRSAALDAAEVVFRVCHQLHGAVGFCDETALSWLSRYSQPLRRLPWCLSATRERLVSRTGRAGLAGLYS
jgi:alkylation response protein AidB-like acyl-CoA dehydrogenase